MNENQTLDRIHIRDLSVRCLVGINEWEKKKKQQLSISITLYVDLKKAGLSDDIEDTVNYRPLKNSIVDLVESNQFDLIERIAELVAEQCLSDIRVKRADVYVDKLGALRFARSVAVEITRYQDKQY